MPIPYVNEKSAAKARLMEAKFVSLVSEAGVIFVSVTAVAVKGGDCGAFEVRLGMNKKFERGTGIALIKKVLQDEIEKEKLYILADVFLGVSGAARDQGHEGTGQAQA